MSENSGCTVVEVVIISDEDPEEIQAMCDDVDRLFLSLLFAGVIF